MILVRSSLKKISEIGFQKARFWTLDDDSRAEKFSGGGATLSRFLHRRVAGNMRPLTGGDAGMIRWGDRWLLILVRRYFKKFPAVVSKKLEFGHLRVKGENDDESPCTEKIFWRGVSFCPIFPM